MAKHRKPTRGGKTILKSLIVAMLALSCVLLWRFSSGAGHTEFSARDANWDFEVREEPAKELASVETLTLDQKAGSDGDAAAEETGDEADIPAGECAAQQVLLSFDGSMTEDELIERLGEHGVKATDVRLVSKSLDDGGVLVEVTYEGDEHPEELAQRLAEADFVQSAGANYVETLCEDEGADQGSPDANDGQPQESLEARSNDPYYSQLWGNEAVGASKAWDIVKANGSVTVAVLDSGVDTDHPDLVNNLILGSYCKNTYTGSTGPSAVEDSNGHGTHVAGIIAATADNKTGVAGVSYNARILPIKVTYGTSGSMYISDVIEGIDYVVSLKTNSASPDYLRNISVINLSLGGYHNDTTGQYQQAIQRANNAGILVVAAAGNEAKSTLHYPAAYENVVGVSALQKLSNGTYHLDTSYSNYGSYVDIAAPGTNIYSTVPGGKYENKTGTSMATPMVSGAAALVYAKNPGASPAAVESLLEGYADDLGETGPDELYGAGAIRADKAVGVRHISLASIDDIPDQLLKGGTATPEPKVTLGGSVLKKGH